MPRKLTPDRFIVCRDAEGEDVLKCCECGIEGTPVVRLGKVWTVRDMLQYIDTHAWAHWAAEKNGVSMSAFKK